MGALDQVQIKKWPIMSLTRYPLGHVSPSLQCNIVRYSPNMLPDINIQIYIIIYMAMYQKRKLLTTCNMSL